MLTLNQIVSQITNLASAHNQIAESGVGDFAEWQAKERTYPILWVFHESTSVNQMEIAFSIRLICADRVIVGEEGDNTEGHEQEVISDTLLVLLDFLAYFQQNHSQPYNVVTSATIDPFTERLNDRLAGNSVTIQIRQPFDWNKCQIPQTGASIPPSVDGLTLYNFCDPAVIARLTSAQVACLQSEYALPADITINSAPFGSAPSGGTFDIPVVNGGNNPVGSEQSGEWVIGNSTVTINGTQVGDIVAEDSLPLAVELDGSPSGTWNAGTQTWEVTSAAGGSISVAVSDDTPDVGDTITITATATGFTPTDYYFYAKQGTALLNIGSAAGGVINWTVLLNGTFDIFAQAHNNTASAFNIGGEAITSQSVIVTTNLQLWGDPFKSNVVPPTYPDISGFGRDGTLINAPTFVAGTLAPNNGGYVELNGVDQYVGAIGSVADFAFIQNTLQFTMSVWVRVTDLTGRNVAMSNTTSSGERGCLLYALDTSILFGGITKGIAFQATRGVSESFYGMKSANNVITTVGWHQVTVTCNGIGTGQIYLDGQPISTTIVSSSPALSTGNSTHEMMVGVTRAGGTFLGRLTGRVGPWLVYNTALSTAQIVQNFDSDKARYGL